MKNTLETRLGLFVALTVLAVTIIIETVGGPDIFKPGTHINALFAGIQDLKKGDPVKMAGVEIGRVEDISLDATNNKVHVRMKVNRKAEVKTDSIASIKFTGLMGQNFVAIDFGSPGAEKLKDDQYISTVEQPDLSAMMAKLNDVASGVENLTKSFTGDKIDNLLGPFTDFLKANREPLTGTFSNLQVITSEVSYQITQGRGTLGKLVKDETLYNTAISTLSNFQQTATEAKTTLADARRIVDDIESGRGTLGKLMKDDKLYTQATEAMSSANNILKKVDQGQGTVGKLINDQEFYKNAKLSLQKLDKATEGLEDQGPLSVMGILINNLF